jgi:hypothetical protein
LNAAPQSAGHHWMQRLLNLLWVGLVGSCLLGVVSFVKWKHDVAEIRRIVVPSIDENAVSDDIISQARIFLRDSVGYRPHDSYFLLPIFRFMRPTALQVIRQGGDCADRARAFIVILNLFDIRARKLALYDARGRSVHAIAKVWTDREPYYVDLAYNIAYEDAGGNPLSLAELANQRILESSIQRAVTAGNARAASYPIEEYDFGNVRTFNWEKSSFTQVAYRVLVEMLGENRAKTVPRPYLSEEPALMLIVLVTGASVVIIMAMVVVRGRKQEFVILALQTEPCSGVRGPVRLPLAFKLAFKFRPIDQASAGVAAGGRISPDLRDPDTLSPDLESLERVRT